MGEVKGRTFVMGDIHGAYQSLLQCLERSGFNKEEDTLIQLGDIVDGFPYVYECVEELLTIKNLITIKGNHDEWFRKWLVTGVHPDAWIQGGYGTYQSYCKAAGVDKYLNASDIPTSHWKLFMHQISTYVDKERNMLFVHAGFNRHIPLAQNAENVLYWDRDLFMAAMSYKPESGYNGGTFKMHDNWTEVFIGHTTTEYWKSKVPIHAANIWNLDTGAGNRSGKLTIMNVDTKEFFQSDTGESLYPKGEGR